MPPSGSSGSSRRSTSGRSPEGGCSTPLSPPLPRASRGLWKAGLFRYFSTVCGSCDQPVETVLPPTPRTPPESSPLRRPFTLVSITLVLVGLEIATRILGTLGTRLVDGFRGAGSGGVAGVGPGRFAGGVTMAAVGLAVAFLGGWAGRRRRAIEGVGRRCPRCGRETKRIRRSLRQRMLGRLIGEALTRRRCLQCGWEGLALKC